MKQLSLKPDKCNFSFLWDFGAKIAFWERCNEIFCFCWLQIYWCCCICKAAVREFVLELVQKWYGFPCHFFAFFVILSLIANLDMKADTHIICILGTKGQHYVVFSSSILFFWSPGGKFPPGSKVGKVVHAISLLTYGLSSLQDSKYQWICYHQKQKFS